MSVLEVGVVVEVVDVKHSASTDFGDDIGSAELISAFLAYAPENRRLGCM